MQRMIHRLGGRLMLRVVHRLGGHLRSRYLDFVTNGIVEAL
jgi:hypothetical protein